MENISASSTAAPSLERDSPIALDIDSRDSKPKPGSGKPGQFELAGPNILDLGTGEPFVLYVGPNRTAISVAANAFKGFSAPLYRLTSNDYMVESHSHTAALPENNPEVFIEFLRVAYKIAISDPSKLAGKTLHNRVMDNEQWLRGFRCQGWRSDDNCSTRVTLVCGSCTAKEECPGGFRQWCQGRVLQHEFSRISTTEHPLDQDLPDVKAFDAWNADQTSYEVGRIPIPPKSLTFYLEMYIFADKYLIPDMAVTSLRAFEARLTYYHLTLASDSTHQSELYDALATLDAHMSEMIYPVRRSLFRYVLSQLPRLILESAYLEFMADKRWVGHAISEAVVESMAVGHSGLKEKR